MTTRDTEQELYDELSLYTLAHPDPIFIHQYVVDAFAAQLADAHTKPITLAFALIGLYLHVERNYSGKNVQHVHMLLARRRRKWPTFALPQQRGDITVSDVLAAAPGADRDAMITRWSASVWQAYGGVRDSVVELLTAELG